MRASGEADPFRRSVNLTLTAIAGFAACVSLAMLAIGPLLMDLAFGDDFDYERGGLVLISIGMGLYLAAATLNQALLAQGRAPLAAAVWLSCAAAFSLFLLLADFDDPVLAVEIAFLGAAAVLCCAALHPLPAGLRSLARRARDVDHPCPFQRPAGLGERRLRGRPRGRARGLRGRLGLAARAAAARAPARRGARQRARRAARRRHARRRGRSRRAAARRARARQPGGRRRCVGGGPGALVCRAPLPHLRRLRPEAVLRRRPARVPGRASRRRVCRRVDSGRVDRRRLRVRTPRSASGRPSTVRPARRSRTSARARRWCSPA